MRRGSAATGVLAASVVMLVVLAPAGARAAELGAPRVIYLKFADGKAEAHAGAASDDPCAGKTPPKFDCAGMGSGCKAEIQGYLDKWYGDFNIVFTYQRPASGKYLMHFVSNYPDNSWCEGGGNPGATGVAFANCGEFIYGTTYTYSCDSTRGCAKTIAQEIAHNVGLMHTSDPRDVMSQGPCSACDGFGKSDVPIVGGIGACPATQNSYGLMAKVLGMWPGGAKPNPNDPVGAADGGSGGGGTGGGGAGGSGGGSGGDDAGAPGGRGGADSQDGAAGGGGPGADEADPGVTGGCNAGGGGPARGALLVLAAAVAMRRRIARRASPRRGPAQSA